MSNIKIIVGLGNNIDNQFIGTRHNIGADYVINLAKKFNLKFKKNKKFGGYISNLILKNKNIILFIPNSFINYSGKSIFIVSNFYKIALQNILIVHDDLDFLPGIIRFKYNGSSGGHNGIKNIIKVFNGTSFYRLRIGIGHPKNKIEVNNFVLSKPTKIEQKTINFAIEYSINALLIFIQKNYNQAVKFLHTKT
ncbi:aminoacyl-tRNA hydrolase [Enterobacteriaceae endosymbiont of Donacia cincticornis]|uniref:aminoacyl-tRNA hydrolase n=1 Tax=Enterobacteriaceae endosymbiont of Donacia cincticornis TaxID=2675773 RepID=UPI00144927A5|nr:aminoacyl-tRNA hydrolase [Enterobacteriaceae endosymbiont of Donacia cincticornis]QJC35995.1 aminoacyl-tRNA hydrolase [Enterobacteriaceae endosymbiont of Donacia cincticornis]